MGLKQFERLSHLVVLLIGILTALALIGLFGWMLLSRLDPELVERAEAYADRARGSAHQSSVLAIIDFTKPSLAKRLHIVNRRTGEVKSYFVSHGSARQAGRLYAPAPSDIPGSHASPAGFMLTGEAYVGRHGRSLRLDGLEARNRHARSRAIVIHAADYAHPRSILVNLLTTFKPRLGESQGCFVVSPSVVDEIIETLQAGALVYVHVHVGERTGSPSIPENDL